MSQDDLEGLHFSSVEKDLYLDPPKLSPNTPDDIKLLLWQEWQKKEAQKRRAHKAAFTRKQKVQLPEYEYTKATFKSGGIHRQKSGLLGISGDDSELIIAVPATQDRHFQPRGKRAGKRQKSKRRKNKKKFKAQRILNQRRKR